MELGEGLHSYVRVGGLQLTPITAVLTPARALQISEASVTRSQGVLQLNPIATHKQLVTSVVEESYVSDERSTLDSGVAGGATVPNRIHGELAVRVVPECFAVRAG